jgi:VanZ family protein
MDYQKILKTWAASITWAALVFIGHAIPGDMVQKADPFFFKHFDKIVHFSMFFGLCFLLARSFSANGKGRIINAVGIAASISFSYALVLETMQSTWFSKRSSDPLDLAADFAGVIIAAFISFRRISKMRSVQLAK